MLKLVCVGKLREKFYAEAAAEYEKRLSRLTPVTVVELPDEREPQNPSEALCAETMRREGERILHAIGPQEHVVALCIEAKQTTSPALAARIR